CGGAAAGGKPRNTLSGNHDNQFADLDGHNWILAGTPDGHPLYTPCTRPIGRVNPGDVHGALKPG
ncbi:MAG: hypothetical protein QM840_05195, partial [Verrucomicrobiota bacterium]|nr:hypothetical protein [Verrucomicrobiota bacterium]